MVNKAILASALLTFVAVFFGLEHFLQTFAPGPSLVSTLELVAISTAAGALVLRVLMALPTVRRRTLREARLAFGRSGR